MDPPFEGRHPYTQLNHNKLELDERQQEEDFLEEEDGEEDEPDRSKNEL